MTNEIPPKEPLTRSTSRFAQPTKEFLGSKKDNLIGCIFGHFLVVGAAAFPNSKWRSAIWVVRCECGNYEHARTKKLVKAEKEGFILNCIDCGNPSWKRPESETSFQPLPLPRADCGLGD